MTTKQATIEEMNISIAAFEGRKFYGKHTIDKFGGNTANALPEMKYHKSWDWIMPVVQKIINRELDTFCTYTLWVTDALRTADINQVHRAVYDFITWHNEQPF